MTQNKLSFAQGLAKLALEAYESTNPGEYISAYSLQCGISTLDALVKHGVAEKRVAKGAAWNPRVANKYRLKKDGDSSNAISD